MTSHLLSHTDLFKAGLARSGAYNRSLTPFGFQSEQRTYWSATDLCKSGLQDPWACQLIPPVPVLVHTA